MEKLIYMFVVSAFISLAGAAANNEKLIVEEEIQVGTTKVIRVVKAFGHGLSANDSYDEKKSPPDIRMVSSEGISMHFTCDYAPGLHINETYDTYVLTVTKDSCFKLKEYLRLRAGPNVSVTEPLEFHLIYGTKGFELQKIKKINHPKSAPAKVKLAEDIKENNHNLDVNSAK